MNSNKISWIINASRARLLLGFYLPFARAQRFAPARNREQNQFAEQRGGLRSGARILCGFLLALGVATSAMAMDQVELEHQLQELTANLEVLQSKFAQKIPAETLRDAQGIIMLNRVKAGVVFGFQGGGGVAMVKEPNSGQWSAPFFLKAHEASFGFQIGGQHSLVVVLLMNTNAVRNLTQATFKVSGQATGTAGDASGTTKPPILSGVDAVSYRIDTTGFYAGAVIAGDALQPDKKANTIFYGKPLTSEEILYSKTQLPSPAAMALANKLTEFTKTQSHDSGVAMKE